MVKLASLSSSEVQPHFSSCCSCGGLPGGLPGGGLPGGGSRAKWRRTNQLYIVSQSALPAHLMRTSHPWADRPRRRPSPLWTSTRFNSRSAAIRLRSTRRKSSGRQWHGKPGRSYRRTSPIPSIVARRSTWKIFSRSPPLRGWLQQPRYRLRLVVRPAWANRHRARSTPPSSKLAPSRLLLARTIAVAKRVGEAMLAVD